MVAFARIGTVNFADKNRSTVNVFGREQLIATIEQASTVSYIARECRTHHRHSDGCGSFETSHWQSSKCETTRQRGESARINDGEARPVCVIHNALMTTYNLQVCELTSPFFRVYTQEPRTLIIWRRRAMLLLGSCMCVSHVRN